MLTNGRSCCCHVAEMACALHATQVRGCVSITRCTMRAFGPSEWKSIKARLANWRESLVAVQQSLVANKAGAASAGVPNRGQQAIKV